MNEELCILMIEDRPTDAGLIERELRQSGLRFALRRTDREDAFREALQETIPDLVLSDLSLPTFSGTQALAMLREQYPEVPLIFVSGTVGEEKAVDLLKLGATDYVLKQHLSRLMPAVNRALREVELKREQREAAERYRNIFENASVGIFQASTRGPLLTINPALATMHGYASPDAMMSAVNRGKQLFADPTRLAEFIDLMEEKGEVQNFEAEMYRCDDSVFWVSLHARAERASEGQGVAYEGFAVDVTRRRELEAQMLRAQRLESIGTLASGVAHDLNNIISPILMSVSLLHKGMNEDDYVKIVSIIESSARRGAQIVKQVLAFGRGLEGERQLLQPAPLITEVLKILAETFPKNVILESSVSRDLWPIMGDPTQIHQVLLNLCVNARDAMPDGGRLKIQAQNLNVDESYASMLPRVSPGQYIFLEVSDSGTGIPAEIIDRIYDPFFTTKGVGKGTGLGLSTVLGIVKAHGGMINVTSKPNRGTTVNVYLPGSPGQIVKTAAPTETLTLAGAGEMILIVDDEEMICNAARHVLQTHGYRVLVARDGPEGLAVFAQNQPTIAAVLTDMMMPYMDGVALIRALRRLAPDVFIIASTGQGENTRLAELRSMGVGAVLDKPYGADTLLLALRQGLHPQEVSSFNRRSP